MSAGGHVIRNRITIRDGYDANSLIIPGDYAVDNGLNVPSAGVWIIEVRVADGPSVPRQIHQLAVSVEGDDMYQRSYNGTVWTAWSISGGGGGGATNLSHTRAATTVTIESDTGADTIIPAADTDLAGVMTADMFDKLAGIATGATAYTDELAQDAVGTILSDAGDIDFTYDDLTPFISAVIKAAAVTFAKMQNIDTARILGRNTAGTGSVESLTKTNAKNVLAMYTASASPPSSPDPGDLWLDLDSGILFEYFDDGTSSQWVEWGTSFGSSAAADDSITFAKMQNIDTLRLIGRVTAGTGDPEQLTEANVRTILGYVRPDVTNNFTVGYTATEYDNGTISSGTLTPAPANGNMQKYTNNGAHTLAPPSATGSYSMIIDMTNGASAGAITTSSWTKVTGDTLTTTNGHKFKFYIAKGATGSHLNIQAMQ